jgi:hypothetical protein
VLYGPGTLFTLGFRVRGNENQVSTLDFITSVGNTQVIDKNDPSHPALLRTQNGSLVVKSTFLRGDVDGNGFVEIKDASHALAIAAGELIPLAGQTAACEVTGDGRCTAADASVIECYVRNQSWTYCTLPASAERIASAVTFATMQPVIVCLTQPTLAANGSLTVSIDFQNAANLASADLSLIFDTSRFDYVSAEAGASGLTTVFNHNRLGVLRVALVRANTQATNFRAANIWFKPATTQLITNTWMHVASVALSDALGRDAVESALQQQIHVGVCTANGHSVYLPFINR